MRGLHASITRAPPFLSQGSDREELTSGEAPGAPAHSELDAPAGSRRRWLFLNVQQFDFEN
jgi:hypothetical protein